MRSQAIERLKRSEMGSLLVPAGRDGYGCDCAVKPFLLKKEKPWEKKPWEKKNFLKEEKNGCDGVVVSIEACGEPFFRKESLGKESGCVATAKMQRALGPSSTLGRGLSLDGDWK